MGILFLRLGCLFIKYLALNLYSTVFNSIRILVRVLAPANSQSASVAHAIGQETRIINTTS